MKIVSNTLTVNTVEDGESAPYYFQEWFAWSNDSTTQSVTTSPTISGSWATSIPAQGSYAYLWRKSIRYVWNENTRQYSAETAQYFRMSGTNGTSIKIKGTIKTAITASETFPTAGFSSGDLGIKQGDSYLWLFNGTAWGHVSSASSDGDSYTMTKDCTVDLDGDDVSENIKGHLIEWSTEASKWIDLGVFQGQSGETWYTHVAWATNVTYSGSTVTAVEGFTEAKSPNDTTHLWMGVLVDQSSGQDPNNAAAYTWSYTKGVEGEDAVAYEIQTSVESVKIPSNETSVSKRITFRFYSKTGDAEKQAFTTYYSIYYRSTNNAYTLVYPPTSYARSSYTYTFSNIGTSVSAIVVYIWGNTDYRGQFPEGQNYLAKKEIPILKDGDTGATGARGSLGRNYYYAGVFDDSDTQKLYVVNDAQVPFFMHLESGQKRYHVFNPETSPQSGSMTMAQMWSESGSSWSNLPWEVMSNDFKYLISEAVFAEFARFASFVMMGHFMFSLQGRWINDRYKDGATLIEYQLFLSNGGNTPIQATAYSFINTEETGVDRIAEFENMSEAGTSVDYKYLVENSIHFVKGTMYSLTWESISGCRIHLIDSQGNDYGLNSITKDQCFQVNDTDDYYVLAERTSLNGMTYTNVSLYQRFFSPNVCINGNTGDASMNNFKGSANLTQLVVSKGEYEGSGVANLGGVTYINQPIFYPDRDTGSSAQDVPRLDTLPQIPLCKYVEIVKKNSSGQDVPDSAGKFYIDSAGYLRYTPILYDNLSVLRPSS